MHRKPSTSHIDRKVLRARMEIGMVMKRLTKDPHIKKKTRSRGELRRRSLIPLLIGSRSPRYCTTFTTVTFSKEPTPDHLNPKNFRSEDKTRDSVLSSSSS